MKTAIYGKNMKPVGRSPAIALVNPKFSRNVGEAVRAASCFGAKQVWFTGDRVSLDPEKGERLPREERMKGYRDVELVHFERFFDQCGPEITPVAVELRPNAELLPQFEHPENAIYVFGPEDGSLGRLHLQHCHRFVSIPTRYCTNLAGAVYIVLYDRLMKRQQAGLEPILSMSESLHEHRGVCQSPDTLVQETRCRTKR